MSSLLAVEAFGLTKSYGSTAVLTAVDLAVPTGTVLALLGPNGAGKTTTVRILSTLLRPDAGSARVLGFDVVTHAADVRRRISLTGQFAALDEPQTGAENLRMMARLRGMDRGQARQRARELLTEFDLADAANRRVATYSGGMRRRLDLAASLVARPGVIFLDEPTTGLDPRSRQTTWQVIDRLVGQGVTVVLTTQYLEEADRLAQQIVLLDDGAIVAAGSPAELKGRVAANRLDLVLRDQAAYDDVIDRLDGSALVTHDPLRRTIGVATDGKAAHVRALLDDLDPYQGLIEHFTVHAATLDDVFMAMTGRSSKAQEVESNV